MTKTLIILMITIFSLSCKGENKYPLRNVECDTVWVHEYNEDEERLDPKNKNKKFIPINSTCSEDETMAYLDIKNGDLKYFVSSRMYTTIMEVDEMKKRFENSKVSIHYAYGGTCIPVIKKNCYEKIMNDEIKRKFGQKFIDSINEIREVVTLKYLKAG